MSKTNHERSCALVYFKVGIPRNLLDAVMQGADAEVYESLEDDALAMKHLLEVGYGEFFFEGDNNVEVEKLPLTPKAIILDKEGNPL